MEEDTLDLQIGDVLQLQRQSDPNKTRHAVRVIGYLTPQSVIVTAPTVHGKLVLMPVGQSYAVRTFRGNSAKGFISTVLVSHTQPYPYVHLSYPDVVQSVLVRNANRVSVDLVAAVRNERVPQSNEEGMPAAIIDLSITGARLSSEHTLGNVDEEIAVSTRVTVGHLEESLAVKGRIRNAVRCEPAADDTAERRLYGIEFGALEREQALVLHAYINQETIRVRALR